MTVGAILQASKGHVPTLFGSRIVEDWKWTSRAHPDDDQLRC
jgi:hypothetical protein